MKRVGIVVPEFRTQQAPGGGVATVADFVIESLRSDGRFEVEVVSPRMYHRAPESQRLVAPRTWVGGPQTSQAQLRDVPVTYVGARWAEFEPFRFKSTALLRATLSRFDVLVVVCGTPSSFELVRGSRVPVMGQVATVVSAERKRLMSTGKRLRQLVHRINTAMVTRLDRSGVRVPNIVFVENPWMREWCERHGAQRVEIELPGIDTDLFYPQSPSSARAGYILSVGRLADPRKNLPLLIRAYALARSTYDVKQQLVIAGRESPPQEAIDAIRALGMDDHVVIKSDVPFSELPQLYRDAEFFVMSSSEEGLGMVMMEAMSSGLPVISTATEGGKVVVNDSSAGVLVQIDAAAEAAMARAIGEYAKNATLRESAALAARERAERHFAARESGRRFVAAVVELAGR